VLEPYFVFFVGVVTVYENDGATKGGEPVSVRFFHNFLKELHSVADPGCLSRIPDPGS
jgi:hypothetical protein